MLDSSRSAEVSVQPLGTARGGAASLISASYTTTTVFGSEQGLAICCTEVPQPTFKYGKEREEPEKHEWLQVEHGVNGVLESCRMGTWASCQA